MGVCVCGGGVLIFALFRSLSVDAGCGEWQKTIPSGSESGLPAELGSGPAITGQRFHLHRGLNDKGLDDEGCDDQDLDEDPGDEDCDGNLDEDLFDPLGLQ